MLYLPDKAYRIALIGVRGVGKRTAQQYLVKQWAAASYQLQNNSYGRAWVRERILRTAASDHPLLSLTVEVDQDMEDDDDDHIMINKLRRHDVQIVNLCRGDKPVSYPSDDVIANIGSIEELHYKLDRVLSVELKRACHNHIETERAWTTRSDDLIPKSWYERWF